MTEETKESAWSGLGFGAYFGGVCTILRLAFADALSLTVPVASSLAFFLTSLGAYPIFIRGTKIRRRFRLLRGEQWTFFQWLLFSVVFTLMVTVTVTLVLGSGG